MSKDLGCKWNFVVRNESSQEQGREDSSFDYFKDKERCLVREYMAQPTNPVGRVYGR